MKKDRFLNVLRWQLTLSKRQIATFALVFFAIVAIPQAMGLMISDNANTASSTSGTALFALSVYLMMAGTSVFTHLKTRQQRINDFMLPATTKEKFIARYLVIAVALPLAAIIGFLAGDVVQRLLSFIFGNDNAGWATGYALEAIGYFHDFNVGMAAYSVSACVSVVALHAFFLLLGSIFHKHPLVMSLLVFLVVNFLLLTLGALWVKGLVKLQADGYVVMVYDNWVNLVLTVLGIAFTVFCYRFAYRKYTRLQVINNKWLNK